MAWTPLAGGFPNHPKVGRLARALEICDAQAGGHIVFVWAWCLEYAPTGDLSRYNNGDIEAAAKWTGEPGRLVEALIDAGWLDQTLDGLNVHDWEEWGGKYHEKRLSDAARKRGHGRSAEHPRKSDGTPTEIRRTAQVEERREEKRRSPPTPQGAGKAKDDDGGAGFVEAVRGCFPPGFKGDLEACLRHGKKVPLEERANAIVGAKVHVERTPRDDLKYAEADVFLRKQLWGRYVSTAPPQPPPGGKPRIESLEHYWRLKLEVPAGKPFPWQDYGNGLEIQAQLEADPAGWRALSDRLMAKWQADNAQATAS